LVLHESNIDTCTFYSYKIIGVCYANYIRKGWEEGGYQPPRWIEAGNALFDAGKYEEAIEAYSTRITETRMTTVPGTLWAVLTGRWATPTNLLRPGTKRSASR